MYVDVPGTLALSAVWLLGATIGVSINPMLALLLFLAILYTKARERMAKEATRQQMQERINNL